MPQDPHPDVPTERADRWNVGRLISWTNDYLKRKGSESPRLEAEVLLAFVLGWERVKLYTRYEEEIDEAHRSRFRDLIRRRAEGVPVAYLIGRKEFYALTFTVSNAVLIPRPDSEFVVVEFLTRYKSVESPRIVDVGTGSGCLALSCLHGHLTATAIAIDISEPALAVARTNAETLKLSERVQFRLGNRLDPVAFEGPFDAIISNPPYIRSEVIPTLERGVAFYEPHLALDGGPDGLQVVGPLITQAVPLLKPGGRLILEIGSDQENVVRDLLEAEAELTLAPTIRDHAQHPRVLVATRRG